MSLSEGSLTTLATVKDELRIALSDTTYDDTLTRYINSVSGAFESLTGRKWYFEAAIVENLIGHGDPSLIVSRRPVVGLPSVVYLGAGIDNTTYSVPDAETGIIYRKVGWPSTAVLVGGVTRDTLPGQESPDLVVTYDGGYVTPQQALDTASAATPLVRNLPYEIETLVIDGVTALFRQRGVDKSMTSSKLTGASATFERGKYGMPKWWEDTVENSDVSVAQA